LKAGLRLDLVDVVEPDGAIIAVSAPEIANAPSLTRMALTPRPRARSSSSLIARSWSPNLDRRTSQATTTDPAAKPSEM